MPRTYVRKGTQGCSACLRLGHNARSPNCAKNPKALAIMLVRAIVEGLDLEASNHEGPAAVAIGAVRKAIAGALEKVAS